MKERMDRTWRWLAVNMGKHAGIVSVVGLAITIIMGFGLTKLDFATDQVRLSIDEPLIPGWNEIDAVKLIGGVE